MGLFDNDINKMATAIGKAIAFLNEIECRIESKYDIYEQKEGFYLVAYICKVGILERIEKNNWSMNTPIYIPTGLFKSRRETITMSLNLTLGKLMKMIKDDYIVNEYINEILSRGDLFYEFEKTLPFDFRKSI